jgi:hypothetical protein
LTERTESEWRRVGLMVDKRGDPSAMGGLL